MYAGADCAMGGCSHIGREVYTGNNLTMPGDNASVVDSNMTGDMQPSGVINRKRQLLGNEQQGMYAIHQVTYITTFSIVSPVSSSLPPPPPHIHQ